VTAKQYLNQIKRYTKNISRIERTIKEIRRTAGGAKAIDYTKDKVQTSPSNHTEDMIIKAMELEDKLIVQKDMYQDAVALITNQINQLNNPLYAEILYQKYVELKSLEQIAVSINFSYPYVKHMHGWALVSFEQTFLSNQKENTQ